MNKASGGEGIPVELFKILKDNAVKALQAICQQIWKFASSHRTEKASFHSNPKEKHWRSVQTTIQFHSFHMLAR